MAELDLEQLRSIAAPLARLIIEHRRKVIEAQHEFLSKLQDLGAPRGFAGAFIIDAEVRLGCRSEDSGAEAMSKELGLHDFYCSATAQAMPAAQQMELMLQGRFAAAVKGN